MLSRLLHTFYLLLIAGLVNAQDFSNKGKDFWVGYGYHQAMNLDNGQDMVLYFTAEEAATVKIDIPAVGWSKTYNVVANGVTETDAMPKSDAQDCRLVHEGIYNTGIHITSDKPIVAYAHIYNASVSAASLLFPVNTLGQDYYSLNFTQKSNIDSSNSWAYVIATEDNTAVEIIPSANTLTHTAGQPFTVTLNKGQIYNLKGTTSGNDGVDLTGTRIRSVSNGVQGCKRIAVFSGSGRVSITCSTDVATSDNLFQQAFPGNAWGRKFLTVPTSGLPNNYFRIAVSDPATVVTIDGVQATNLINGFYYEIMANTPKSIVADKPVMVAQYITSTNSQDAPTCGNSFNRNGDPEMIYLSPVEQTIDKITLNSTKHYQITSNYINVVIKSAAINSFTLDGVNSSASFVTHPQDPAYSYAVFAVAAGPHSLKADSGFNATAYGYGTTESYGYNAGTNIKDLYQYLTIHNPYALVNSPVTCQNTPFSFLITLPYKASSLTWDFGNNPGLFPNQNVINSNPIADSAFIRDGRIFYVYKLSGLYKFSSVATFPIKIFANNQTSDGCNGVQEIDYDVQVTKPPVADFTFSHTGCVTDAAIFTDASNANSRVLVGRMWDFGDGTRDTLSQPRKAFSAAGTYSVKLTSINDIGCSHDTIKPFVIAPQAVAKFGLSATTCVDSTITFTDSSTIASGSIVKWYWDFGDGTTIANTSKTSVVKTYSAEGTYTVSLQVENNSGCKSVTFQQPVTVHPKPIVNFNMPGVCLPSGVAQFTNLSSVANNPGNSLTYSWNFGDGTTSAQTNPSHNYATAGPFNVNLKATTLYGCSGDTTIVFNNIFAQPHAAFNNNPNEVCKAATIHFADSSIADNSSVTSWFWNFGDGTTSNIQNPDKVYATTGSYIVSLYVKSAAGCTSNTATKTVTVNKAPAAAFTLSTLNCEKQPVTIKQQSTANSGTINNWYWNFGDGTDVAYQNGSDFSKTYNSPGNYAIKLIVQTDKGCKSDTAIQTVVVGSLPVANFIVPAVCLNDPFAAFTDSSYISSGVGGSLSYLWNFGDPNASAVNPNSSTDKNPQHKYSAAGVYNVSLTVTSSSGCSATVTKQITVSSGSPKTDFTLLNNGALCGNTKIEIQNTSSVEFGRVTKIELLWDAQNAPSTVETYDEPPIRSIYSHTYPSLQTAKTYAIKMRAFSGATCVSEKMLPITINGSPKVTFAPVHDLCANDSARTITQASETTGIAGSFTFSGNDITPAGVFNPAAAGTYNIKYVYTSTEGCKDSASQTINVVANPTVQLNPQLYVLEGGSVELVPVITGDVTRYSWTPATYLDNASIRNPRSIPKADVLYNLTVSTTNGCKGSGSVSITLLKTLAVPNAFSPNGDGINDVWTIKSLESFSNCSVQVYNRYGKTVFNTTGYNKPWDGTYNGSALPVGVYYYIIDMKNGTKPYSGSVTILK